MIDPVTELSLYLVFIDMFMHIIPMSTLKILCILYNVLIGCTLSWEFCSIYILCIVYSDTELWLHLYLY